MLKSSLVVLLLGVLAACSDADVVSRNLSKSADMFEVNRRVVFYNGITDTYMLTIEGRCSLGNYDNNKYLSVTCKVGDEEYKKHFLGLSDNVTYFVEQLEPLDVSVYHYRVVFKPQVVLPDVDFRGDLNETLGSGE